MAKKIIVYTTPTCPYCRMLKEFLKQNKVKYEERDVSANEKNTREMVDKSKQMGVPVLDIDGKIVVGFDEDELKELLDL